MRLFYLPCCDALLSLAGRINAGEREIFRDSDSMGSIAPGQ